MSPKLTALIQEFENFEHKNSLYIKFPDGFQLPDNPQDFLFNFLTNYSIFYNTFDEILEKQNWIYPWTLPGKRRSVNETFDIVKYYYPNYTILQYFFDIYDVIYRIFNSNQTIICHYCNTINRYVFQVNSHNYKTFLKENNLIKPHNNFYSFAWLVTTKNAEFWSEFHDFDIFQELTNGKYSGANSNTNKAT